MGAHSASPGAAACDLCVAGQYQPFVGRSACQSCALGTFSDQLGRSAPCPVCPANSVCVTPDVIESCPSHTTSAANSTSQRQCLCVPGFSCTYTQRLVARIVLNISSTEFFANATLVAQLKKAVADACGVPSANVFLIGRPANGVRSLNSRTSVHFIENGAERMLRSVRMHPSSPVRVLDVRSRPTHFIFRRREL
jgi:hypothetical protein